MLCDVSNVVVVIVVHTVIYISRRYGILIRICTNKALYLFGLSTALLLLVVNVID